MDATDASDVEEDGVAIGNVARGEGELDVFVGNESVGV